MSLELAHHTGKCLDFTGLGVDRAWRGFLVPVGTFMQPRIPCSYPAWSRMHSNQKLFLLSEFEFILNFGAFWISGNSHLLIVFWSALRTRLYKNAPKLVAYMHPYPFISEYWLPIVLDASLERLKLRNRAQFRSLIRSTLRHRIDNDYFDTIKASNRVDLVV